MFTHLKQPITIMHPHEPILLQYVWMHSLVRPPTIVKRVTCMMQAACWQNIMQQVQCAKRCAKILNKAQILPAVCSIIIIYGNSVKRSEELYLQTLKNGY